MPVAISAVDLISQALADLGLLGGAQTADGDDQAAAFTRLNQMLDAWALERAIVYATARTVQTLTDGVASYTIGPGGTINIPRPIWIPYAAVLIPGDYPSELPIAVFTVQDWSNVAQKALTSALPQGIYLDTAWTAGLSTLYVWPIPNGGSGYAVVLYTPTQLAEFADLATAYTFPPGYQRALRTNLAVELAPLFGRPVDPLLGLQAVDSKAWVKRANHRQTLTVARVDQGLLSTRGAFNWLTGQPANTPRN